MKTSACKCGQELGWDFDQDNYITPDGCPGGVAEVADNLWLYWCPSCGTALSVLCLGDGEMYDVNPDWEEVEWE